MIKTVLKIFTKIEINQKEITKTKAIKIYKSKKIKLNIFITSQIKTILLKIKI